MKPIFATRRSIPNAGPVRGIWYGDFEEPAPEAPCYGCRIGLRRAAIHWPEPLSNCFEHVHLVRDGITIECTGTWWKIEQICKEDGYEVFDKMEGETFWTSREGWQKISYSTRYSLISVREEA